jgi:predicted Zn-dependent peptidase
MSVRLTTLPNGFRIITDSIATVETASVGVWIGAGSRNETIHNNGVAHFLEHMAFKGTTTRSAYEIARAIEDVGGYLNAYTSREITAYYARVLKQDVGLAIDILGDILENSIFAEEELLKERDVILQEISQSRDTPDDIVFDYFQETAYPNQPLGRTILGPERNVTGMTRETLIDFMQTHYNPSQMVFAAAGNVNHEEIVEKVQGHFHLKKNSIPSLQEPAFYQGGTFQETRELEQLHLILGFQGISTQHKDFYTAALYSTILGGGMSSRLFQEVREKRGLAYSIYSFSSSYKDSGIFGVYAGTSKKEGPQVIQVVKEELHKSTHMISEEEVNRAKSQLKAGLLMGMESTSHRAKTLAQQLLTFGKTFSPEEIVLKIESPSLEEIHSFGKSILSSSSTLAAIGPLKILEEVSNIK